MWVSVLLIAFAFTGLNALSEEEQGKLMLKTLAEYGDMLQNITAYDEVEKELRELVERPLGELGKDVLEQLFVILKATVPRTAHPTDEQLKEMSKELAKRVDLVATAFRLVDRIPGLVYKIASNTTLLTMNVAGAASPSKFARAVELIGGDNSAIHDMAVIARCAVDKQKLLSRAAKRNLKSLAEQLKQCREERSSELLGFLQDTKLFVTDAVEIFASEKNAERTVRDFSTLMEALKNVKSYESLEEFTKNIAKSRSLKAYADLYSDVRRCVRQTLPTHADELREAMNFIRPLAMTMFTAQRELAEKTLDETYKRAKLAAKTKMNDGLKLDDNFIKCLLPESDFIKMEKVVPALNGKEEDEAKTLVEVAKISKTMHALTAIGYEHMHSLRNRVGVTPEVDTFFTTTLIKWRDFILSDGTTEAGRQTQERVFRDIGNSFIALSDDAKRVLADHFPTRTILLLSAVF